MGHVSEEHQASTYYDFYSDIVAKDRSDSSEITDQYCDFLTKTFVKNMKQGKPWNECGVSQFEAQCLCKVPTLVARYYGDMPTILAEVKKMIRIWQVDEGFTISLKFCTLVAKLLHYVLENRCSPADTLQHFFEL